MLFGKVEKVCFEGTHFSDLYSLLSSISEDSLSGKRGRKGTTFY